MVEKERERNKGKKTRGLTDYLVVSLNRSKTDKSESWDWKEGEERERVGGREKVKMAFLAHDYFRTDVGLSVPISRQASSWSGRSEIRKGVFRQMSGREQTLRIEERG